MTAKERIIQKRNELLNEMQKLKNRLEGIDIALLILSDIQDIIEDDKVIIKK